MVAQSAALTAACPLMPRLASPWRCITNDGTPALRPQMVSPTTETRACREMPDSLELLAACEQAPFHAPERQARSSTHTGAEVPSLPRQFRFSWQPDRIRRDVRAWL